MNKIATGAKNPILYAVETIIKTRDTDVVPIIVLGSFINFRRMKWRCQKVNIKNTHFSAYYKCL